MYGREGYDRAFGISRRNLGMIGLWPSESKYGEINSAILFTISLLIISIFVTIAQTAQLIIIWGDLTAMIDNISTANLPIFVVVLKMFLVLSNRKALKKLLTSAIEDWNNVRTKLEMENMKRNASSAYRMSFICIILGCGSVNGQCLIRLTQELNLLPGPIEKRLPMISSYFPYDYKPFPIYEITWFLQYTGAALATVVYSGVYCLFCALVLHLKGQVMNLKFKLENIEQGDDNISNQQFSKIIGSIIERHDKLYRFAEEIETIFSVMFLAEIVSCTVQICSQLFMFIMFISDNEHGLPYLQVLFMMIYVSHVGTHVYICCYVTDQLREESLSISKSAYNYRWYNLSPQNGKLLIMIMRRAEKPMVVTAGKFVQFSLRLYAQILKTSGGYLSMLLAVKDRSRSLQ